MTAKIGYFHIPSPRPPVVMLLTDLVEPTVAAMHRHAARLQLLAKRNRPGMSDDLREESAHVCEEDIQNIIQPGYQAMVDSELDPEKKVRVLADCQKQLKDLVCSRIPRIGDRPDEGYYSIFIEGSVDAARAVYAKICLEVAPVTPRQWVSHQFNG